MSGRRKRRKGKRAAPRGVPQAAPGAGALVGEHDRTHLDWLTVTHAERQALWEVLRPPTEQRYRMR